MLPRLPPRPASPNTRCWSTVGHEWLLTLVDVQYPNEPTRWFAPFALGWEDGDDERMRQLAPAALAKVRMQAQVGVLADALADAAFCHALVLAVGAGRELRTATGRLRFRPTRQFAAIAGVETGAKVRSDSEVGLQVQGSMHGLAPGRNTTAQLGERLFLKVLRQVQPGINAEIEVARFLHEVVGYAHGAPAAGSVDFVASDGAVSTLALLHAWVPNQGSAWSLAVEHLARQLERTIAAEGTTAAGAEGNAGSVAAGFLAGAQRLAQCTVRLHAALASRSGDAAFDPEPVTAADMQQWTSASRASARATLSLLRTQAASEAAGTQTLAVRMAAVDAAIDRMVMRAAATPLGGIKCRIHGGYRLQEILLVKDDFVVVDFEGDPTIPLAQRRTKQSPLRDVAAMLRSFDQARRAALQLGAHAEVDRARREAQAHAWGGAVREAFLQAYATAAVATGLWPDAACLAAQGPLLALFELDLVLRELRDELQQRPLARASVLPALDTLMALTGAG